MHPSLVTNVFTKMSFWSILYVIFQRQDEFCVLFTVWITLNITFWYSLLVFKICMTISAIYQINFPKNEGILLFWRHFLLNAGIHGPSNTFEWFSIIQNTVSEVVEQIFLISWIIVVFLKWGHFVYLTSSNVVTS